jgi:hypothetical protein
MLLLAGPAVAASAIGAGETPFPSIADLVAELERISRDRESLFNEYAKTDPVTGHRYAEGRAYFDAVKPYDDDFKRLVFQLAKTEAHTPADIRLKAKVAEWHFPAGPWDKNDPTGSIMSSLFRDLGVV